MAVFLVPADRSNLEASIEGAVSYELIVEHLPDSANQIRRLSGIGGIHCWAMTNHRSKEFEFMQPGDDVLFSESGTGKFTHYGQVIYKTKSQNLGKALWPYKPAGEWENIYFLRNIQKLDVNKEELVVKLGYEPTFKVPGVIHIKEDRLAQFEQKFGLLIDSLQISATEIDKIPDAREQINELDYTAEDVISASKVRRGQAQFATKVKTAYGYKCGMCGIEEAEFLVASHIIPWAKNKEQRLNPRNGICLCVFHDRAFERGYLLIDKNYQISINPKLSSDSLLYKELAKLNGLTLLIQDKALLPDTEYLDSHRALFT